MRTLFAASDRHSYFWSINRMVSCLSGIGVRYRNFAMSAGFILMDTDNFLFNLAICVLNTEIPGVQNKILKAIIGNCPLILINMLRINRRLHGHMGTR